MSKDDRVRSYLLSGLTVELALCMGFHRDPE